MRGLGHSRILLYLDLFPRVSLDGRSALFRSTTEETKETNYEDGVPYTKTRYEKKVVSGDDV